MLAAVDIETFDPHLEKWGPGSIRKDGKVLGIGIYCPDRGIVGYYDPKDPIARAILNDKSVDKVFHNGVYDLDWLMNNENIEVRGRCEDTMTRETLLDAYQNSYHLDDCCSRRGVAGKNRADTIEAYWEKTGGKGKVMKNLHNIPRDIVAKYCIQDCKATYDLFQAQESPLKRQDLQNANEIEVQLYPLLMDMRKNGIPLSSRKAYALSLQYEDIVEKGIKEIERRYGLRDFSLNAAAQIAKIWEQEGIPIVKTETGRPSFSAAVLDDCDHPIAHKIKELRGLQKTITFVDSWLDASYNSHLYPSFYPAKRDEGGTVTGRWSSRNPNLQQVPAREDKHGTDMRALFIPEPGHIMGAFDYKQIEYRVFTHYAIGEGAEDARQRYRTDPDVDYHQMVVDLMGWNDMGKEGRHIAKMLNFGSLYGMGAKSFAERFKQPLLHNHPERDPDNLTPVARDLLQEYFEKVPFVRPTCQAIQETGKSRGYVTTLSGRRQRLTYKGVRTKEPFVYTFTDSVTREKVSTQNPEEALARAGSWNAVRVKKLNLLGRDFNWEEGEPEAYKLINYLIQGSAADILKKGLVDAWNAGIFEVLKLHATVHDECVFSIPVTKEGLEATEIFTHCLMGAYIDKLRVPLGVDTEVGVDWGHCNGENYRRFTEEIRGSKG